jgi:multiple antibiotic resistance protein
MCILNLVQDPLLIYDFLVFFQAFVTLFAIFDPIGALPIFSSISGNLSPDVRNRIVRTSCIVSFGILIAFSFGGIYLFQLLGTTLTDFRIFGGLILLIFAIRYVLGRDPGKTLPEQEDDIAVFPLATPLLAGPGSISVALLLVNPPFGPLTALIVIMLNVFIAWIILRFGLRIYALLGKQGSSVISRIMGLIIGAVSLSLLREGLTEVITQEFSVIGSLLLIL